MPTSCLLVFTVQAGFHETNNTGESGYMKDSIAGSVILAAGRGSRMKGFAGNKTLLPLVPAESAFIGSEPFLLHILQTLPPGPRAIVVHHEEEAVVKVTAEWEVTYCRQPELNGTGGALIAAQGFLREITSENIILTMGDTPLVRPETYLRMITQLKNAHLVVLGFEPLDRRQYGILETDGNHVSRIIEWQYWKDFSKKAQQSLRLCNSGIYAAKRETLLRYLDRLASHPHVVEKERDGSLKRVEEFFITDLVAYMHEDGVPVGYITAEDEHEVMGVDTVSALKTAQRIYAERFL